uniref:Uncharacterized protein n=1 Tax=Anguilla anguilla TaxID=7936 RepID=A0A0E9VYR0_ANGAN
MSCLKRSHNLKIISCRAVYLLLQSWNGIAAVS